MACHSRQEVIWDPPQVLPGAVRPDLVVLVLQRPGGNQRLGHPRAGEQVSAIHLDLIGVLPAATHGCARAGLAGDAVIPCSSGEPSGGVSLRYADHSDWPLKDLIKW